MKELKMMLKRVACKDKYTIGHLYLNGKYFCDTLEDKDRGLTSDMPLDDIKGTKKKGETAIPKGTYDVTLSVVSPKYSKVSWYKTNMNGGRVPRLLNVPGFDGILIHSGNTPKDTEGCILVGENKVVGQVINSKDTLKKLYQNELVNYDKITITIE